MNAKSLKPILFAVSATCFSASAQQASGLGEAKTPTFAAFRCVAAQSNVDRRRNPAEVQQCASAHNMALWGIYQTFLATTPGLQADLMFYLAIEPTGVVTSATGASTKNVDKKLVDMLSFILMKINFGYCANCAPITIKYPVTLRP